jgi:uncharacterized protein YyaL (SSP411 family)
MPNRLARETSPYLLQHANNPVDWHPWGPEALERAKREDRPIFLSIGYSACHWCHVMEHESFEDEAIATALNERFVNVKVDREERPDLDQIYMAAVQLMTQHGGWPMSVWLTPDLKPFYGGTYFPPADRHGLPSFLRVIHAVAEAWNERRAAALQQAEEITTHISAMHLMSSGEEITPALIENAVRRLEEAFDRRNGGFGGRPKFPHPMDLSVLLRHWKRSPHQPVLEMVKLTLDKMAAGGIYDHLAGGFARYSVDERWLVPHFEKMLYDNALLTVAYLEGYQATGDERYARVARETCEYVLRYMTDERGGFHSTEDADSEGEEGKFYVWTPDQIIELLGRERGDRFCNLYDVTPHGNFEGENILNLPRPIAQVAKERGWNLATLERELAEDRAILLEARDQRVRPGKDDKILTNWNALMIDAFARAAVVLDEPRYATAAQRATAFILRELRRADGRLLHSWRGGEAKFDAYLDDYAYFINALVSLYEADFDEAWIDHAVALADFVMQHFHDGQEGGFFYTSDDHEQLIARQKDVQDSSVPSASGMTATALIRLGTLTGRQDYVDPARGTLELAAGLMEKAPTAAGQSLIAADMLIGPMQEIVVVAGDNEQEFADVLAALRQRYEPNRVIAARGKVIANKNSAALNAIFAGRTAINGQTTLYVCENFTCQAPLVGWQAIGAALAAPNEPSK